MFTRFSPQLTPLLKTVVIASTFLLAQFWSGGWQHAYAHPAPSVMHDYIVSLSPSTLSLESYLRVSPELVAQVYREIDTNGDGQTSQDESGVWFNNHPAKLGIALDGTPMKPSISQAPSINREDLIQSIDHPIKVTYTVTLSKPISGKHRIQITYGDNYVDYDEYYISVANDAANDPHPVGISRAKYPATYQIVYHIPTPDQVSNVPSGEIAPAPFYQGAPVAGTTATAATVTPQPVTPQPAPALAPISGQTGSGSSVGGILDSLRTWHGEFWSALGLALLALLIGALHALTPGHGKTMVAAYLIGSKGRVKDAVLLGGVVTFTHTVGVVILGLILLFVSTFTVPRNLQPILELISGVIVIGLGAYLLLTRWRDAQSKQAVATVTAKSTGSAAQAQARAARQPNLVAASAVSATTKALAPPTVSVAATQTLERLASPAQDQDHDHEHEHGATTITHTHDGHTHTHAVPSERLSLGSLIGLGISGGLVPCPDALAILLLATGVGQFALGLGLVISFSIGLAAVLIGIGVALVIAKGALARSGAASLTESDLWTRWVPLASAAVVVIIGLAMALTALGGFRS